MGRGDTAGPALSSSHADLADMTFAVIKAFTVELIASPSQIPLGNTTNLTVLVSNGIPYYTFSWGGLPTGCSGGNVSSFRCTPEDAGHFVISVTVTDSSGHTATNTTGLTVGNSASSPPVGLPFLIYLVAAGVIAALVALGVLAAVLIARRRRRKNAPFILFSDSPYVPPEPPEPPDRE
jgi:PKD domain-containing protein